MRGQMGLEPMMMPDGESINITKAENGYMVTFFPNVPFEMGMMPFTLERPEPHQIEEMKEAHRKPQRGLRPR